MQFAEHSILFSNKVFYEQNLCRHLFDHFKLLHEILHLSFVFSLSRNVMENLM
jgi:hypothetical protein